MFREARTGQGSTLGQPGIVVYLEGENPNRWVRKLRSLCLIESLSTVFITPAIAENPKGVITILISLGIFYNMAYEML